MNVQFYKRDLPKEKILNLISHIDFEHLVVETDHTINHIEKIKQHETIAKYFWLIKIKSTVIQINDLDLLPKTFSFAESLVNELCGWIEYNKERINKITALLVVNQFDDLPK